MTTGADRWIRWTTTGCVTLLALIAGHGPFAAVLGHAQPSSVGGGRYGP
jgi:hypothetical protein